MLFVEYRNTSLTVSIRNQLRDFIICQKYRQELLIRAPIKYLDSVFVVCPCCLVRGLASIKGGLLLILFILGFCSQNELWTGECVCAGLRFKDWSSIAWLRCHYHRESTSKCSWGWNGPWSHGYCAQSVACRLSFLEPMGTCRVWSSRHRWQSQRFPCRYWGVDQRTCQHGWCPSRPGQVANNLA